MRLHRYNFILKTAYIRRIQNTTMTYDMGFRVRNNACAAYYYYYIACLASIVLYGRETGATWWRVGRWMLQREYQNTCLFLVCVLARALCDINKSNKSGFPPVTTAHCRRDDNIINDCARQIFGVRTNFHILPTSARKIMRFFFLQFFFFFYELGRREIQNKNDHIKEIKGQGTPAADAAGNQFVFCLLARGTHLF